MNGLQKSGSDMDLRNFIKISVVLSNSAFDNQKYLVRASKNSSRYCGNG